MCNVIYNEDCLETMKKLKDKSVDLIVTSPPYNMNLRIMNGKYKSRTDLNTISTKYSEFQDKLPLDEYYETHLKILKECIRISKITFYNIQIVTGSKRAWFKIIGELSNNLKELIVWDKCNSQPAMSKGVLNRQSEFLLVFEDENSAMYRQFKKCNFTRGTLNDVWQIKRGKALLKGHSATFPEELITKILLNFSNEGDVVYDPFLGSGTTCVVAKRLNRQFIGSELIKNYFEFSEQRLKIF